MAFPTALTLVYFVALAGHPGPVQQGVYLVGKAVQFGFPVVCWLLLTRRWPRVAWPGRAGWLAGALFGLAVLGLTLALYHGVVAPRGWLDGGPGEAIRAKVRGFGVNGPGAFLALGAFYAVLHSAAEEYYWRWFVFGALRHACGAGWAILWSSAAFMAHHVVLLAVFFGWGSPWTFALSLAVAGGGACWAWLYQRSGSLLGPWLGHLLVDAAIFAVGYDLWR